MKNINYDTYYWLDDLVRLRAMDPEDWEDTFHNLFHLALQDKKSRKKKGDHIAQKEIFLGHSSAAGGLIILVVPIYLQRSTALAFTTLGILLSLYKVIPEISGMEWLAPMIQDMSDVNASNEAGMRYATQSAYESSAEGEQVVARLFLSPL